MGWANVILDGVSSGLIDLPDAIPPPVEGAMLDPVFFPTDTQEFDEEGNEIKFKMGMQF
jgi:hypothetical protein